MRLIVAITGSSGAIYGIRLLEALRALKKVEVHLILSKGGMQTIGLETGRSIKSVQAMAHTVHSDQDLAATISSGSFRTAGMIVAPCSMKTLSGIVHSYADNLVVRAADVVLKERRKLVLVPRETPLSEVHLENLLKLARMGVTIVPPMPAFYNKPATVDDIVNHIVARVLDQFDVDAAFAKRWDGKLSRPATVRRLK